MADALAGPLRHPRPLTAAELHLQLEKEQEAVVSLFNISPRYIDILNLICIGKQTQS